MTDLPDDLAALDAQLDTLAEISHDRSRWALLAAQYAVFRRAARDRLLACDHEHVSPLTGLLTVGGCASCSEHFRRIDAALRQLEDALDELDDLEAEVLSAAADAPGW